MQDLPALWQAALFERFRTDLKPVPHVLAVLEHLRARGIAYCVASSGTLERIDVALTAMNLKAQFAHIFSAEHVTRGKPAPDLFLYAASQMSVKPDACFVIEDSPYGIRAAQAAGMRSAGFVGGLHLQAVQDAHAETLLSHGAEGVLSSLQDLIRD